jgi:CRISPR system Cascade subunit CasE
MYLSEALISAQGASNPYEIHRHLWRLFDRDASAPRPFLFRVRYGQRRGPAEILLQSAAPPDRTAGGEVAVLETKVLDPRFRKDQVLRFALCANPVKRLNEERCRVPLTRHEDQIGWLSRKLSGSAALVDTDVVQSETLHFRRHGTAGKIVTLTFTGYLRVADPEVMRRLLAEGVGPAKSFGCGLLSLARA